MRPGPCAYNRYLAQEENHEGCTYVIQYKGLGGGIDGAGEGDAGLLTTTVTPQESATDFYGVGYFV